MRDDIQKQFEKSCWALVARRAWQKPGVLINLYNTGEYLFYPLSGQGCYFVFKSLEDGRWYHSEIENREPLHGPFRTRQETVSHILVLDESKIGKWEPTFFRSPTEL